MKHLNDKKDTFLAVIDFNGGMNRHISPYLLNPNTATYLENAEVNTGKLVPLKKDKVLEPFNYEKFKWFDDTYIPLNEDEYAHIYSRQLYVSNGDIYKDKDTKTNFKVDAPKIACNNNESELYNFSLAIIFKDENDNYYRTRYMGFKDEIYETSLYTTHSKDMKINVLIKEFYENELTLYNDVYVRALKISKEDSFFIVKIAQVVIGEDKRQTLINPRYIIAHEGNNWTYTAGELYQIADNSDFTASDYKLVGDTKSLITELPSAQYVATFYNPTFDLETIPSNIIKCANVTNNYITLINSIPSGYVVRLYKLTDDGLIDFTLVKDNITTQNFYDDTITINVAGNHILDSQENYPIPDNITHSAMYKGIHVVITENKLYFSKVGYPAYFPLTNIIIFEEDLEGIGVLQSGLVIFSKSRSWIISGYNEQNFYVYPLSYEVGCLDRNSITYYKNAIFWVAYDGVYTTTGGTVENITKNHFNLFSSLDNLKATTWNERILISGVENKTLVIDFRYNLHFYFVNDVYKYFEVIDSELRAIKDTNIVAVFKDDENRTLTYKSPKFVFPTTLISRLKYIKDFELVADKNSELNIQLTIDDIVSFIEYTSYLFDNRDNFDIIRYKINKSQFRVIEVEIKSKGTVYEYILN